MTDDTETPKSEYDDAWDELEAAEASGGTPPEDDNDDTPEPEPAPEPEGEPEPEPDGENDDTEEGKETPEGEEGGEMDIWADAPEPLKAAYQALKGQYDDVNHRYSSDLGRIRAIQREHSRLVREKEELKAAKAANTKQPEDGEEVDPLAPIKDEYPELAGPLGELVGALTAQNDELRSEVRKLSTDSSDKLLKEEFETFVADHPDFADVTAKPEFTIWLDRQPEYVQDAFERNREQIVNAKEASHLLSSFKSTLSPTATPGPEAEPEPKPKPSGKRDLQRRSVQAPPSKNATASGHGMPDKDDYDANWEYFDRLEAAKRQGR